MNMQSEIYKKKFVIIQRNFTTLFLKNPKFFLFLEMVDFTWLPRFRFSSNTDPKDLHHRFCFITDIKHKVNLQGLGKWLNTTLILS